MNNITPQEFKVDDIYHRVDGPALIDGTGEYWYYEGNLHRGEGLPAVIKTDGTKQWHVKGKLHRIDGPAVEQLDGLKEWHIKGKLHREDGPAVEHADGGKEWYISGRLQRTDGPAIIQADGSEKWYFKGKRHRKDGGPAEYNPTVPDGASKWFYRGQLHRVGGPAIDDPKNGITRYYVTGKEYKTTKNYDLACEKFRNTREITVAELQKVLGGKFRIVKRKP